MSWTQSLRLSKTKIWSSMCHRNWSTHRKRETVNCRFKTSKCIRSSERRWKAVFNDSARPSSIQSSTISRLMNVNPWWNEPPWKLIWLEIWRREVCESADLPRRRHGRACSRSRWVSKSIKRLRWLRSDRVRIIPSKFNGSMQMRALVASPTWTHQTSQFLKISLESMKNLMLQYKRQKRISI